MHADELHKHLHELNNIRMGRSTLRAGRIKFVYESSVLINLFFTGGHGIWFSTHRLSYFQIPKYSKYKNNQFTLVCITRPVCIIADTSSSIIQHAESGEKGVYATGP